MSITAVKPYFTARAKAVGLKEHVDAFNDENVAASVLNEAFHIQLGNFTGIKHNQTGQEIDCPVTVKFWVKGYRLPGEAVDRAVLKSDELIKECLKNSNRLGTIVKNVSFSGMALEPMALSNDNGVKVTLNFNAFVIMAIV